MEEQKELVSEENYNKGKSLIKKVRIVLCSLGALLLVGGIVMLIVALTHKHTVVQDNPFGAFTTQQTNTGLIAGGATCIAFGFILLIYGLVTYFISHRREILAFGASTILPVADEVVDAAAPIADKASKAIGKGLGNIVGGVKEGWTGESNTIQCPECNTENPKKNKFCKNCGKPLSRGNFCPKCGKKIDEQTKFCPNCGEKIEQ